MKKSRSISFALIGFFLLVLAVGCSNEQLSNLAGPDNDALSGVEKVTFDKKKDKKTNNNNNFSWPIIASKEFPYNNGHNSFKGGQIEFGPDHKSKFQLEDWSMTAPPSHPQGEDITLTVQVDYDETAKTLFFEFGPHGCQFNPRAEMKMDYSVLGVDVPVLMYWDETLQDWVEQQPDQIKVNKKWLKIRLDHFSRYAVAISRLR